MALNASIASRALVQVCADSHDGRISCQYHVDLGYDQDTFSCKLIATARSVDSNKNISVYLILNATNIKAISLHSDTEVPPNVAQEFVKQARCTVAAKLASLHLALTQNVLRVVPDLTLRHKASAVKGIDTLLRLGRCEAFTVYVPLDSANRGCLATLCDTLDQRVVKSAERFISTLYAGAGHKIVTHIDQRWSPNPPRSPPPYEFSRALGANNHEVTSQSVPQFSNGSVGKGKRRLMSPDSEQIPSKRQSFTQKAALEPWRLPLAAQGAQLAALHAELSTLRQDMQRLQRAPHVDAGTRLTPWPSMDLSHPLKQTQQTLHMYRTIRPAQLRTLSMTASQDWKKTSWTNKYCEKDWIKS
jgi:hypothetical protein